MHPINSELVGSVHFSQPGFGSKELFVYQVVVDDVNLARKGRHTGSQIFQDSLQHVIGKRIEQVKDAMFWRELELSCILAIRFNVETLLLLGMIARRCYALRSGLVRRAVRLQ